MEVKNTVELTYIVNLLGSRHRKQFLVMYVSQITKYTTVPDTYIYNYLPCYFSHMNYLSFMHILRVYY